MKSPVLPKEVYQRNAEKYSAQLTLLKKKRRQLGWLRLLVAVVFSVAAYYGFGSVVIGWIIVMAGVGLFLTVVSFDVKNNEQISHNERLLFINVEEIKILAFDYGHREDGLLYSPSNHAYAEDFDVFGKSSVYQYITRCTSEQGKETLASALLTPSPPEVIIQRQQAVQELKQALDWRQEFQVAGLANPLTKNTQNKIANWIISETPYRQPYWAVIVSVYTVITLSCVAASLVGLLSSGVFTLLVFLFFTISLLFSRRITSTYLMLSKIVSEVQTLQQQLKYFEELNCSARLLIDLRENIIPKGKASKSILELKRILDRFDYRLNVLVFFVLNTFLLWDLRQIISLNKWKATNATLVDSWFATIAHLELINSLSTLSYNHPSWVVPTVSESHFTIFATELGHPLINEDKRVNNGFSTEGTAKVSIVTGSNMAGKSTFLRSLGVNLVLAHMGAPVCAASFVFSPVELCSSMRIADNLAENTSTFYAELKKLKGIIEKVRDREKVFILLDEILRGTNSLDKHKGSEALIKQLISEDAVAVIATHDVELGKLESEYQGHISNYYFDVQVEGEELYFDYKIKRGICQSMNASLLMKKIGIMME